jgi:hypothetical protein
MTWADFADKAIEALRFYANEENYAEDDIGLGPMSTIGTDEGNIARMTLKDLGVGE